MVNVSAIKSRRQWYNLAEAVAYSVSNDGYRQQTCLVLVELMCAKVPCPLG